MDLALNRIASKVCNGCNKVLPATMFGTSNAGKYLRARCKPCCTAAQKKYYQDNLAAQRAYHTKYDAERRVYDVVKKRATSRRRYHTKLKHDPCHVFSDGIRRAVNLAFRKRAYKKRSKTFDLLGYTPDELRDYLIPYVGKPCERCNDVTVQLGNSHIDHITPIRTATSREDILKLNALTNLRLICASCNLHKQGRIEE